MSDQLTNGQSESANPLLEFANTLGADIILFNQTISERAASELQVELDERASPRKTVFFILATFGGDPHAAYMIARELQRRYEKIVLCIAGDCYSAGTLIVMCAHELVIADRGRLGPLDVQILKKDELRERLSGLTVGIALEELNQKVSSTLVNIAVNLKNEFGPQLSFRTALDLSATVTAQIYGEVYKQIDPIRLGEDVRALQIAGHYGTMLGEKSRNILPGAVYQLTAGYPAHECVIDRDEAKRLFTNVRAPAPAEQALLQWLEDAATNARLGDSRPVLLISPCESREVTDGVQDDGQTTRQSPNEGSSDSQPRREPVPATRNGSSRGEDLPTEP